MFGLVSRRRFEREIQALRHALQRINQLLSKQSTDLSTAVESIDKSSQAELHARVMDLERAFERFSNTQRRELGALHRKVAILDKRENDKQPPDDKHETPEETRARLRGQLPLPKVRANGVAPGED